MKSKKIISDRKEKVLPRKTRKKSVTGIYHCILRGINQQDIFFEDQDYFKFLNVLLSSKNFYQFKLLSYVLMPNHIHLQVKDEKENLSKFMHNIEIRYSTYFNKKYKRIGHFFENRFFSVPVETENYIKNLVRYIHQNPQNAYISTVEEYRWSSYNEYLKSGKLVDTDLVWNLFENNYEDFIQFNKENVKFNDSKEFLEYEIKNTLTDNELIYFIKEVLKIDNIQDIQKYNNKERDGLLRELKKVNGCTCKQLSRVLGLNIRIIQRAFEEKDRL